MSLRQFIHEVMGANPTKRTRLDLANELEAEAQLADAEDFRTRTPPSGNSVGRPSLPSIRIIYNDSSDRNLPEIKIRISAAAYYTLHSPRRVDVQRLDGQLTLFAVERGGYAVSATAGGFSITASGARDILPEAGKYRVKIFAGDTLRVGERIED